MEISKNPIRRYTSFMDDPLMPFLFQNSEQSDGKKKNENVKNRGKKKNFERGKNISSNGHTFGMMVFFVV